MDNFDFLRTLQIISDGKKIIFTLNGKEDITPNYSKNELGIRVDIQLQNDRKNLQNSLKNLIYNEFYINRDVSKLAENLFSESSLAGALKKITENYNNIPLEGWGVESIENKNGIIASKANERQRFEHGNYLKKDLNLFLNLETIVVGRKQLVANIDEYFWVKSKKNLEEHYTRYVRFYFNIKPIKVAELINDIKDRFNLRRIPFLLKCFNRYVQENSIGKATFNKYERADSLVLYLDNKHLNKVINLIYSIHEEYKPFLHDKTPLFTLNPRGRNGLGFAESPEDNPEISFGENISSMISDGILQHIYVNNVFNQEFPNNHDLWIEKIKNSFVINNYDLERLYLKPNSKIDLSLFEEPLDKLILRQESLARRIAFEICNDAVWDDNKCNWIGFYPKFTKYSKIKNTFRALDGSIASGTAGISYFLINAYIIYNDKIFLSTSIGAINHALDHKNNDKLGFYGGFSGILFTLKYIISVLEKNHLPDEANQLQTIFDKHIEEYLEYLSSDSFICKSYSKIDIYDGLCGIILFLLNTNFTNEHYESLRKSIMLKICNYLISIKQTEDNEKTYLWQFENAKNLSYSKGMMGVSYTLIKVGLELNNKDYIDAGYRGILFINNNFENGNWIDFRYKEGLSRFTNYKWIEGASGILLAQHSLLKIIGDDFSEKILHRIEQVISTLPDILFINPVSDENKLNFSLSSGFLGIAEAILEITPDETLIRKIIFNTENKGRFSDSDEIPNIHFLLTNELPLFNGKLQNLQLQNEKYGFGGGINYYSPDLLNGLSGIGYFILRIENKRLFNSILLV